MFSNLMVPYYKITFYYYLLLLKSTGFSILCFACFTNGIYSHSKVIVIKQVNGTLKDNFIEFVKFFEN